MPIKSPCAKVAVGLFLAKQWDFWPQINTYGVYFFAYHLAKD